MSSSKPRRRRLDAPGDPYPVVMGEELVDHLGGLVKRVLGGAGRLAVVTQRRVQRLHGERLEASLRRAGLRPLTLVIGEGEENKNLATVEELYDRLVTRSFTRDDAILAFGGGVVGDTAGFVAATYLRGIRYAQLPTTLLAQIDSAIGAKVGVNHSRGKNLIGAIYRPSAVWLDPSFLRTLPERDFRSGLFELLKYGFIGVPTLLRRMERGALRPGTEALSKSIAEGVRRKLAVVREDEGERGLRRILNFGHTIGHGLETAGDYKWLRHGEAVAWGMVGAIRLARRRGAIDETMARRLEALVRRVGPVPALARLSRRRVLDAVTRDKKTGPRGLRFVLPIGFGKVEVVEAFPLSEIAWALDELAVGVRA